MKIALLALAVPIILSGCGSSKYPVGLISNPSNAAVTCNGTPVGYAPVVLYYELDKQSDNTRVRMNCYATWASGATARYPEVVNVIKFPNGAQGVATRPDSHPNYSLDAQMAMQGAQQAQQNTRNNQNNDGPIYTTCNRIFGQLHCTSF